MTHDELKRALAGKIVRGIESVNESCIVLRVVPNRMTRREQEVRITIVATKSGHNQKLLLSREPL